jgi:hypothetical protein
MLRVLRGMPLDGRGERLIAGALAGDPAGYLHVVRTAARAAALRAFEREGDASAAPGFAPRGVCFGGLVVRLSDLVRRTATRRTHPRIALDRLGRETLLDALARNEARPPLRGVPGLAAWLGDLFSALKQGDVFTVDRAFAAFRSLDRAEPGTVEALRLFGVYQARLVEHGRYDEDGLYLELARDLGTPELPFDRVMPARRRLVVEGFYQTNVVERAVFERLFAAFEETLWLVDVAPGVALDAFGARVFADQVCGGARLDGDLTWLRSRGASGAEAADGDGRASGGGLDWAWDARLAARTELAVAPDERAEARHLAGRAAGILREDPRAEVVIAYPSDREAAPLLREACAEVGLPLRVSALRPLSESPFGRALLRLLELASRDFPRERVVAVVRGAEGGVALGDVRLRASVVDRVSRRAGIAAGAAEWRRKLERLARRTERELGAAAGELERARLEREVREIADVRAGLDALIEAIPDAARPFTFTAFAARVRALIERFELDPASEVPPAGPAPEETEARASRVRARRTLDSILETYETTAPVVGGGARPWGEHLLALRALAACAVVPDVPALRRGATLVGVRELRGLATDHLLVGGLAEDALPGRTEPTPLLDEADAARAGVRTADARRREAEHLLVHALWSPRRTLVLSRPLRRDACDVLPALALERIRDRFGLAEMEVQTPHRRGRRGALASARRAAEVERLDPNRIGRFEGLLEPAALPFVLGDAPDVVMSASRFDDYAECPQAYFFAHVLKLAVPDDADPDVLPNERGEVVHRILRRFHEAVRHDAPRPEKTEALARIARAEAESIRPDGLLAHVFLASLLRGLDAQGPPGRPGLLRAYLDYEDQRGTRFVPAAHEARFGRPRHDADRGRIFSEDPLPLTEVEVDGRRIRVAVKGSIDRVDVAVAGNDLRALVLDYKTGDVKHARQKAANGMSFQLPLYARVVPSLLASAYPDRRVRVLGAAYYHLQKPDKVRLVEPLIEDADRAVVTGATKRLGLLADGGFAKLVAGAVERVGSIVAAIAHGVFHPTAATIGPLPCEQCNFAPVCRGNGESARITRMPDPRLYRQAVPIAGIVADGGADDAEDGA